MLDFNTNCRWGLSSVTAVVILTMVTLTAYGDKKTNPRIAITTTPLYDSKGGPEKMDTIKGTVSGIEDCKDCKVVVFTHTVTWYVQPFANSPYTMIKDGKWTNDTHLGTEYAALLVRGSYMPPATTPRLPDVGGDVLAIDIKAGKKK